LDHITETERLRRAVSYLEKAWACRAGSPEHLPRAEKNLAQARAHVAQRLARLNRQLTVLTQEQARLSRRLMNQKIDPARANEINRRRTLEMAQLRDQMDVLTRAGQAAKAADLGGFIDLPLEDYVAQKRGPQASRISAVAIVVWITCLCVSVAGTWLYLSSKQTHALRLQATPTAAGHIEITCYNDGPERVALCVPWLEAKAAVPSDQAKEAFGLAIYVQDNSALRLLPFEDDRWFYRGTFLKEATTITVPPNQSASVTFALDPSTAEARVVLCDADGAPVHTVDIALH